MSYVWKLVCGDETLVLHGSDNTTYKVLDEDVRYTAGEMRLPIVINRAGGNTVGTMQRLDREIRRFMQKAAAWNENRQGKPVDLVCKIDDGLGDIEPIYGRGHMRLRVLAGRSNISAVMAHVLKKGLLIVELTLYGRPYFHGKLTDVADATGWVREVADKGVEVWEATTNLCVNPCLAFPTDWDQRWSAYNATDLVASQSTSHWRSLGSAAKLRASATLPGVFTSAITLANNNYVLSGYVYKEGAAPTTADVEMWAGHVFENFTTAAAAPTAPLVEAVAGGGTSAGAGGEWRLNTSAAAADAAIVYYNAALDADKIFRIRTRFRAPTVTNFLSTVLSLTDKAAAPAISAGGAGTGGGVTEIWIFQDTAGNIKIRYWDNAGANFTWDGVTNAWVAGAANVAYFGALGTTYRADVISNGTSWQVVIYDANDVLLTQTTAVTWALTRAIANSLWVFSGDDDSTNYQSDMYLDYLKIDVSALVTTFEAEDSEHPDWYRMTSAPFTMPSTSVLCGVEVKAGRYVYLDDFQVELKNNYATPFANGDFLGCAWSGTAHDSTTTRTAGSLALNNRNIRANRGAITLWWKPGLDHDVYSSHAPLFDIRAGADSQRLKFMYEPTGDTFDFIVNGTTFSSAAQTFNAGDWVFLKARWDYTNDSYAVQVNGGTEVVDTTAAYAPEWGTYPLWIGTNAVASEWMNGTIHDLRIWDEPLTSAQGALVYAAGRGLGELPWLWTAAGAGAVNNREDSTYVGSAWLGGIPGEMPAGMKLWSQNPSGAGISWFGLKALGAGEYQFKYPYVLEGETMTNWSGAAAVVADADHSAGNYRTDTASSDPYGYIVPTTIDAHKLFGRWRVFARAACTGAATADWNIAIEDLRCNATFPVGRRWAIQDVAGNNTVDQYNWLDLGVIDLPPTLPTDEMRLAFFPRGGTSNYIRITLDVNEAAAAETFRMDCIELLPDETLAWVKPDTVSGLDVMLIDSTTEPQVATCVYWPLRDEMWESATALGAALRPSPQYVHRIIARFTTGTGIISAGTGGTFQTGTLDMMLEPRFEALR